jgi:hypothetical protein
MTKSSKRIARRLLDGSLELKRGARAMTKPSKRIARRLLDGSN